MFTIIIIQSLIIPFLFPFLHSLHTYNILPTGEQGRGGSGFVGDGGVCVGGGATGVHWGGEWRRGVVQVVSGMAEEVICSQTHTGCLWH